MPKYLVALLLALLALLVGPAFAGAPRDLVASTTGELVVDAEGRVASVKLDHKDLGVEVMSAFEQQIREWRFEPVLVDGKAVRARAGVHLDMRVKMTEEDGPATLIVRSVRFSEPPAEGGPGLAEVAAKTNADFYKAHGIRLSPPQYPSAPLLAAAGGKVLLQVRLDAEGRVERVGTRAAELFNVASLSPAWQRNYLRQFTEAAEKAAKKWRLPAFAGTDVYVPVEFRLPGDDGRRWLPMQPMPVEALAWMQSREDEALLLSNSGEQSSDRFRLLTTLN